MRVRLNCMLRRSRTPAERNATTMRLVMVLASFLCGGHATGQEVRATKRNAQCFLKEYSYYDMSSLRAGIDYPVESVHDCPDISSAKTFRALMTDYDSMVSPQMDANVPVQVVPCQVHGKLNGIEQVFVEVVIQDIVSIDMDKGMFVVDLWVTIYWEDHRLNFENFACKYDHNPTNHTVRFKPFNLALDFTNVPYIWNPNVCVVNSFKTTTHKSPSPNQLAIVYHNGATMMNHRVRVAGPCDIDLTQFPLDVQECSLVLESYSYHRGEIIIEWMPKNAINFQRVNLSNYHIPEFEFVGYNHYARNEMYTAGYWDQLVVNFRFKRMLGFYFLQAFAPSTVCIFTSWIGFYFRTDAVKARVILGVLVISALAYVFGMVASFGLPRASYMRAFDVWIIMCYIFTFASLVMLTIGSLLDVWLGPYLHYLKEKGELHRLLTESVFATRKLTIDQDHQHYWGDKLDSISMKAFPIAFGFFNVAFWMITIETRDRRWSQH